ncbi:hypothetical protein [Bifidobacterium favimelis]|uniref:Uncharacterized protein n=1 Tax=Bifidobacterium favimelis TaxID=3122979 RepID=A0ABU8ZLR3_9BIFI
MKDLSGMSLLVHGKGGRDRMVPLGDGLAGDLSALPKGYVFPFFTAGMSVPTGCMPWSRYLMFRKRADTVLKKAA